MTISSPEKLGEHLRARRAQVQPEQVGLPLSDRRRVAGLRRKEVAELAGLGVDYYTRLEQERECRPSASELNSPSNVLMLDDEAQRYLFAIEAVGPSDTRRKRRPRVSDNPLAMVEEWPSHPVDLTCWTALYAGHPSSHNGGLAPTYNTSILSSCCWIIHSSTSSTCATSRYGRTAARMY